MSAKVVLVTGCSEGGIGYHLAEQFAERGCRVYATARNVQKMSGLFEHPEIRLCALDVISDTSVQEVVDTIIEKEAKINIVVNNAGVAAHGPTLEFPLDQVKEAFDTNVYSVLRVCRAALPHMAARKQGLFITIGSIVGDIPLPWGGIYAVTKAAVHSIAEVMSMECRPFNIDVMLVAPGGIKSNIVTNFAPKFALPENTLYQKFIGGITARVESSQGSRTMATDEFAKAVVGRALSQKPPTYVSIGAGTRLYKFFKWLPRSWVFAIFWKRYGK